MGAVHPTYLTIITDKRVMTMYSPPYSPYFSIYEGKELVKLYEVQKSLQSLMVSKGFEALRDAFDNLKVVDEDKLPTLEEAAELGKYRKIWADPENDKKIIIPWSLMLWNNKDGNLERILESGYWCQTSHEPTHYSMTINFCNRHVTLHNYTLSTVELDYTF